MSARAPGPRIPNALDARGAAVNVPAETARSGSLTPGSGTSALPEGEATTPAGAPAEPGTGAADLGVDDLPDLQGDDLASVGAPVGMAASRRGWRGILRADGLTSPLRLLAELALDPLLTPHLRQTLRAGEPVVVTVTVPGPAWVDPVEGVVATASGGQARSFTQASRPKPSTLRDPDRDAIDRLAEGRPLVAITPDAGWLAPALAAAADLTLVVPPLNVRLVNRAIAIWCGGRVRGRLDPGDLAGLDLLDVAAALRPGSKPGACVQRLRRASLERIGPSGADSGTPLAELAGYGPAHGWATALVADIGRVRRGELKAELLEGALFYGIPGTGKTTLARAIASAAGVPFAVTSVGDWFSNSSGNLDGVIKAAERFFDALGVAAKASGTAVGFLDEIDALPNRSRLSDRGADWWLPVITFVMLRVEALRRAGVVLLAATNDLSRVDAALLRPGRLDRRFEIAPPDEGARIGILRTHLGSELSEADLVRAARVSHGATGAVLAGCVRAARRRAQARASALAVDDLLAELVPPDTRSPERRRGVALHEAAHAVLAHRLGHTVVQVTIQGGRDHEGATVIQVSDPTPDRAALEREVIGLLAGRAADTRLGSGADAGARSDLFAATGLLAAMQASLGLGERLSARVEQAGALALLRGDPALSDLVEADLRRLEAEAERWVVADRAAILAVAEALLAESVLTGAKVAAIATSHPPRIRVPARRHPPPGPEADPVSGAQRLLTFAPASSTPTRTTPSP